MSDATEAKDAADAADILHDIGLAFTPSLSDADAADMFTPIAIRIKTARPAVVSILVEASALANQCAGIVAKQQGLAL